MFSSRARAALVAAFTALLLLASSSGVAFAVGGQTGTLEGRVIDDAGLPIAGAAVSITSPSGAYATKTDTRGTFRIIGVLIDTYALSLTKEGFSPYSVAGITVPGDQTVALGALKLQRSMRTIAHVTSRSSSSAFQPGQTQDSITFSGKRVTEAQGKAFNTDQQALVASAPGVQVDQYGNLSIRGSLTNEIGLNLDGVDYTSIDQGGAMQSFLNGIGSLSVNPGAGDATENSSGAGAVNLIPKRGTYPAFGTLDLEAQSGYFNHQFGFEYGFATPDGRLSNYTSFTGQRFDSEYGPYGSALADAGPNVGQAAGFPSDYLAAQQGYSYDNDFLNNFIYKFGAHKAQSLQVLYQTHAGANTFDVGGLYPSYPYLSQSPIFGVGSFIANGGPYNNTDIAAGVIPLYPGQSNASQLDPNPSAQTNIVQFLKLEYDNNINASTFLATRLYHVGQVATDFDTNGTLSSFGGSNSPQQLGGSRIGASAELSKQISSEHLLTISGKYEVARNIFSVADPYWGFESLAGQGLIGRSDWYDFLQPANPNAPLTFPTYDTNGNVVSHGANDCPASYLSSPAPGGCWLYYYNTIVNPGYFKSGVPRIPPNLIGSPENPQDFFAFALRDQMTLGPRLHVDAGIRFDGANNHLPSGLLTGNVGPDDETNYPHVVEPRFSFAYQIDRNDALRFSYGRSVIFPTGGTLYTPLDYRYYLRSFPQGANSLPSDIPGTDFGLGLASNPILPLCGSGLDNAIAPRPCTSYADLIRWEEDYFAPDNGNAKATTYSNLDMTLSHQFRNGFAIKVTPFYKRGYDVAFLGLAKFTIDPTTGAIIPQAFRNVYTGFSKSTGVEVYLSSPERPVGLSGFLSATYVNSLANRPAGLPGEDNSPLVPFQALQAGNVYRSGYDSPLVVKTGFQYQSRGGIRINPVITYDRGYPIGSGLLTPVFINGVALNVPATNNAAALPVQNATGAIAPVFIDPTDPCTVFKPCTYASRGTAETASPGGILSSPRVYANVSLEYSPPKSRATFGVQVINIGNNYYSEPFYNQRYQPVATGVSGPLSGQLDPTGIANYGVVNYSSLQRAYSPYNLFPSATPRTFLFYYQMSLEECRT